MIQTHQNHLIIYNILNKTDFLQPHMIINFKRHLEYLDLLHFLIRPVITPSKNSSEVQEHLMPLN